jgi:hypothetical protein
MLFRSKCSARNKCERTTKGVIRNRNSKKDTQYINYGQNKKVKRKNIGQHNTEQLKIEQNEPYFIKTRMNLSAPEGLHFLLHWWQYIMYYQPSVRRTTLTLYNGERQRRPIGKHCFVIYCLMVPERALFDTIAFFCILGGSI